MRKITHFLSEKGKKKSEKRHFNIFWVSKSLLLQDYFLSLLTEYIKIDPKEDYLWQTKEHLNVQFV